MPDHCHPVTVAVDGQPETIRVHGGEPPSEQARAAIEQVVAAARRLLANDPYCGVIQELGIARLRACAALPDGETKDRLRAAVRSAVDTLVGASDAIGILAELVRLHDSESDRAASDAAWDRARSVLRRELP